MNILKPIYSNGIERALWYYTLKNAPHLFAISAARTSTSISHVLCRETLPGNFAKSGTTSQVHRVCNGHNLRSDEFNKVESCVTVLDRTELHRSEHESPCALRREPRVLSLADVISDLFPDKLRYSSSQSSSAFWEPWRRFASRSMFQSKLRSWDVVGARKSRPR